MDIARTLCGEMQADLVQLKAPPAVESVPVFVLVPQEGFVALIASALEDAATAGSARNRRVVLADVRMAALAIYRPLAPDFRVERVGEQLFAGDARDRAHGGVFVGTEEAGAAALRPGPRGGH